MYRQPRTILEVFKSLPEGTWCQVVNNRLVMSPATTIQHQDVLAEIMCLLHDFTEQNKLGKLVMAPMDTYLYEANVFQPDLLFISNERRHIIQDYIRGVPDLIVEALLPES